MNRSPLPALLLVGTLALAACGDQPEVEEEAQVSAADTRLADAEAACASTQGTAAGGNTVQLADDGQTLLLDTNPLEGYGPTRDANSAGVACVLDELGTPASVVASIERTTAMMGVQESSHDSLAYSWTYHPDSGAEMIITTAAGAAG